MSLAFRKTEYSFYRQVLQVRLEKHLGMFEVLLLGKKYSVLLVFNNVSGKLLSKEKELGLGNLQKVRLSSVWKEVR